MPAMNTPQFEPYRPEKPLGRLGKVVAGVVGALAFAYLLNPTLGIFEILPDNLPVIGNLDEAFFTFVLLSALGALGLRFPFVRRR